MTSWWCWWQCVRFCHSTWKAHDNTGHDSRKSYRENRLPKFPATHPEGRRIKKGPCALLEVYSTCVQLVGLAPIFSGPLNDVRSEAYGVFECCKSGREEMTLGYFGVYYQPPFSGTSAYYQKSSWKYTRQRTASDVVRVFFFLHLMSSAKWDIWQIHISYVNTSVANLKRSAMCSWKFQSSEDVDCPKSWWHVPLLSYLAMFYV